MEKLTTYENVFVERNEKPIKTEITLPEYLPSAARIVRVTAVPCLSSCECGDGILANGHIRFTVLYATEPDDSLRCASFSENFSHSFNGGDSCPESSAYADCRVTAAGENAGIISPRHLSLSCTLILEVRVQAQRQTELFDTEESDTLKKRTAEEESLRVTPISGCEFKIEERIQLDKGLPEIKEILSCDCSLGTLRCDVVDGGKHRFSGNALFSCVYIAREEGDETRYVSFEKQLPYTAFIDVDTDLEKFGACASACLTQLAAEVSRSSYGDSDGIRVEISGCIKGNLYGNVPVAVCRDILCTKHDCSVEMGRFPNDILLQLFSDEGEIRESVRMSLGGITEIVSSSIVVSDCRTELSDGRPLATATARLRILGSNSKGGLESASADFTIKHPTMRSLEGGMGKYRLEGELSAGAPECRIENGEVVCRFTTHLDLAVILRSELYAVSALSIDDTTEYERDLSRYVICYPDKNDTVWSVAKAYKVLPEDIISANGLSGDKIDKRCLIIPR